MSKGRERDGIVLPLAASPCTWKAAAIAALAMSSVLAMIAGLSLANARTTAVVVPVQAIRSHPWPHGGHTAPDDGTNPAPLAAPDGPRTTTRPRILVLTANHLKSGADDYAETRKLRLNALNKRCYAAAQGFDHIWDSTDHLAGMTRPGVPRPLHGCPADTDPDAPEAKKKKAARGCRKQDQLPPHFNKVLALQKYLPLYDWVLWMDTDQWVRRLNFSVTAYIDEFEKRGVLDHTHLFVPADGWELTHFEFSNSVFLIRNSDVGRRLLDQWFGMYMDLDLPVEQRHVCSQQMHKNVFTRPGMWHDQGWMYLSILASLQTATGQASKCFAECTEKVIPCIRADCAHAQVSKVFQGPGLENQTGPTVFANLEPMLASPGPDNLPTLHVNFDCAKNWERVKGPDATAKMHAMVHRAFSWHLKPRDTVPAWGTNAWPDFGPAVDRIDAFCRSELGCNDGDELGSGTCTGAPINELTDSYAWP